MGDLLGSNLQARLEGSLIALYNIYEYYMSDEGSQAQAIRIGGKIEGVKLALGFLREEMH